MMRPVTILARRTHTPTVCPRNQPRIVPRPRSKRVVSRTVRALRLSGRRRTERKHAGEHCLRSERTAALSGWIDFYNRRRPHGALSHKPPIARLNELNNLLGSNT